MPIVMAAIAIAGAVAGGVSIWQQGQQEQAALNQQKESAWQQYLLGKQYSDAQYDIQRNEAQYQAAVAGQRLDQNVNQSVDQFNTELLAQAFGTQNAQIQTASGTGASLAAEGMSGARGSASGDLMRDYERQSLARGIDLQNRQNAQAITGLTTQASNAMADITRERDSWYSGGYRYQMKQAQDSYNYNMAQLGQTNFDWQMDMARPTGLDYFTGVMGGASSGMSLATNAKSFGNAWNNVGK